MGKIVKQGVEYGGSSNSADCIKYNDTKSVKEAIDEIKASSSSDPTASSVTFNNTDTGLNATNVQDAVTEVNGKLNELTVTVDTVNSGVTVWKMGKFILVMLNKSITLGGSSAWIEVESGLPNSANGVSPNVCTVDTSKYFGRIVVTQTGVLQVHFPSITTIGTYKVQGHFAYFEN